MEGLGAQGNEKYECVWREEKLYIIKRGTRKQCLLCSDLQGLNDPGLKDLEIIILGYLGCSVH